MPATLTQATSSTKPTAPKQEQETVPSFSHRRLVERLSPHAAAGVVIRIRRLESARETAKLGVHRLEIDAFLHACDDGDSMLAAIRLARRLEREVERDLRGRKVEPLRHDAHDLAGDPVENQSLSQDVRPLSETRPKDVEAQDHDGRSALPVFFGAEAAADGGRDAEHFRERSADCAPRSRAAARLPPKSRWS